MLESSTGSIYTFLRQTHVTSYGPPHPQKNCDPKSHPTLRYVTSRVRRQSRIFTADLERQYTQRHNREPTQVLTQLSHSARRKTARKLTHSPILYNLYVTVTATIDPDVYHLFFSSALSNCNTQHALCTRLCKRFASNVCVVAQRNT